MFIVWVVAGLFLSSDPGRAGLLAASDPPMAVDDAAPPVDKPADKPTEKPANPRPADKKATLTVIVTGNGRPIERAEVKLKFPASVGGEEKLYTNKDGQATFTSSATGAAKVRVIAEGWEAVLKDVELKKGAQTLSVSATP